MADPVVVQKLVQSLRNDPPLEQASAVEGIRDLAREDAYRQAFFEAGALESVVGLVSGRSASTLPALEALRAFAEAEQLRPEIVKAGALGNMLGVLQDKCDSESLELRGSLQALLALSVDEPCRLAFREADGVPIVIHLLDTCTAQDVLDMACQLLGRLGHNAAIKDYVREHQGLIKMLKLLKRSNTSVSLAEVILQALTILLVDNEVNQDQVSDQYGMEIILKLLDTRLSTSVAIAATICLTALCLSHEGNKHVAREKWALPLLVTNLEKEDTVLVEKTIDCLRVLTSGNEANKLALFGNPTGVRSLIQLMTSSHSPMMVERSAAVIGNLSTTEQFFGAIRERGGLQRLVQLLDEGPQAKVTEIAAKTLANLAGNVNSRKSIRLAGGVPPLVNLMTQRPGTEVMSACEGALRRLQITNVERNAVLETLRYCDQNRLAQEVERPASSDLPNGMAGPASLSQTHSLPLTQFSVEDVCSLLRDIGLSNVLAFKENDVTGGDLLHLDDTDLKESLHLSLLQARKVEMVKTSYRVFEAMCMTPGKGEITSLELRAWLERQGLSLVNQQAVLNGLKTAMDLPHLSIVPFKTFARHYQWLDNLVQTVKGASMQSQTS